MGGSNLIISTVLATFAHLRGKTKGKRTARALFGLGHENCFWISSLLAHCQCSARN